MSYSVSLWFDEAAEAQIREVWQGLADAGVKSFVNGPIRPHVTLAHQLELDLEPFVTDLRAQLEAHPIFELTFPGLGLFVDSGILYLSTVMTDALWTLHRDVYALALAHKGRSSRYYQPDRWTPHCTLALDLTLETMLRSVAACQTVPFPLVTHATRVGVIENPSEVELSVLPLPVRQ